MTPQTADGATAVQDPEPLTPDALRQILRECVTVVRPGETLIIRTADWTPEQADLYQTMLNIWLEDHGSPFLAVVVHADGLAIAEAGSAP